MFHFADQRDGEDVIRVIRKHPIVFVRIALVFFAIVGMPVLIGMIFWFQYYPAHNPSFLGLILFLVLTLYALFGLLLTCIAWMNEEFDLFILTNQRLVDVTQISLLRRTVSSTPLNQVQDATSKINGFLQTLLNYGDVNVATASAKDSIFFIDRVPDPAAIAKLILDCAYKDRGVKQEEKPAL